MQIQRTIQTVNTQNLVIQIPESFVNKQVEILVITLDEPEVKTPIRYRTPPAKLAEMGKETGDIMSSVSIEDWGID